MPFCSTRLRQPLFLIHPHLEHCVFFVDRKNYRLQNIQLSKITRIASPLELTFALFRRLKLFFLSSYFERRSATPPLKLHRVSLPRISAAS